MAVSAATARVSLADTSVDDDWVSTAVKEQLKYVAITTASDVALLTTASLR
jgi:hypothetical protein